MVQFFKMGWCKGENVSLFESGLLLMWEWSTTFLDWCWCGNGPICQSGLVYKRELSNISKWVSLGVGMVQYVKVCT